jgi:hypothetical protein
LAIVWLVVELAAIPVANRVIEWKAAQQSRGVAGVHASVGSFPLVTRYLITGRVSRASVTLNRVERLSLTFTQVTFELDGVALDRAALLQRQAKITAIDRGTVTATLDLRTLPPAVARVARNVHVSGRTLLLGAASFQMSSDIMPCSPTANVSGDVVTLSCTFTHIPPVLLEAQRI